MFIIRLTSYFVLLVLFSSLLFSCSKEESSPSGPGPRINNPFELTVVPDSGIPGSSAAVSGITADPDSLDSYSIFLGDEPTAFRIQSDGSFLIFFPLFLDSTGYSAPPISPQTLEIIKDTVVIGRSITPVTVSPLPKAPGSTQKVVNSLEEITISYEAMLNAIPVLDSTEIPVREALIGTMKALISEGDSSLMAVISGNSAYLNTTAYNMDLLDALMASTGLLDAYEELSSKMLILQDTALVGKRTATGGVTLCVGTGRDELLACGLQIYVMLQDWNNQVLDETVGTWSTYVDLPASIVGISGKSVPHIAVTSAILNILQFFMDKSISGLFPSHVTQFELVLVGDTIGIDEFSQSSIMVSAENTPVAIEVSDLIKLLSAISPLSSNGNEFFEYFHQYLGAAAEYVLNVYASLIEQYEADNPGTDIDGDLFYSPNFYYGPFQVNNADLVELKCSDETIAIGDEAELEWNGLDFGTVSIFGKGRGPGDRSKMVYDNNLCFGCVYTGGAFGQSDPVTDPKELHVGRHGQLEVIIEGLPNGVSGDVTVTYPNGATRHLTETETLDELEPGDYDIMASEVTGLNDEKYILQNNSWTITIEESATASVTVTYEAEYGNLLLTVTNLPDGVDADIEISGPGFSYYQIYSDTLLDSLPKGDYVIVANQVLDTDGETYLIPDPDSQNVTINPGETSIANVTYDPALKMTVYYGSYTHTLEWVYPDSYVPLTNTTCGSSDGQTRGADSIFVPDLTFNNDCILEGGNELLPGGSFSSSASCGSGTASGSVSFEIQYGMNNDFTVIAQCNAVAMAPPPTDSTPFAQYSAGTYPGTSTTEKLIIEIENEIGKNLAFIVTYSGSTSRSGDLGASYGAGFMSNLYTLYKGLGYCINYNNPDMFYLNSSSGSGDTTYFNGVDTLSLNYAALEHLAFGLSIGGQASATTYTDQNGEVAEQRSGQATATCEIRFKLIELP